MHGAERFKVTVCFSRFFLYLSTVKICYFSYLKCKISRLRRYICSLGIKRWIIKSDIWQPMTKWTSVINMLYELKHCYVCQNNWYSAVELSLTYSYLENFDNINFQRAKLVLTWLTDTVSGLIKKVAKVASTIN